MSAFLVVPCSIRPGARSPHVSRLVAEAIGRRGHEVVTWDLRVLPFHGWTTSDQYPPSVAAWREAVKSARAIIWVTPTYHNDLPGVAKSAIDLLDIRVMRGQANAIVGAANLTGEPGAMTLGRVLRFIGGRLPYDDLFIANLRETWPADTVDPPPAVLDRIEAWVEGLLRVLVGSGSP